MSGLETVAAIAGVLDVSSRLILKLYELAGRYHHANESITILITHVVPVRTALEHLLQWVQLAQPNHQLAESLTMSVSGCRMLLSKLDTKIARLFPGGTLDWAGKLSFIFGERDIRDCQTQLDHQIVAMNLLLSVCKAPTSAEQKTILDDEKTVDAISILHDDVQTLCTQDERADAATVQLAITHTDAGDDFMRAHLTSDFERQIQQAPAYQAAFKSSPVHTAVASIHSGELSRTMSTESTLSVDRMRELETQIQQLWRQAEASSWSQRGHSMTEQQTAVLRLEMKKDQLVRELEALTDQAAAAMEGGAEEDDVEVMKRRWQRSIERQNAENTKVQRSSASRDRHLQRSLRTGSPAPPRPRGVR